MIAPRERIPAIGNKYPPKSLELDATRLALAAMLLMATSAPSTIILGAVARAKAGVATATKHNGGKVSDVFQRTSKQKRIVGETTANGFRSRNLPRLAGATKAWATATKMARRRTTRYMVRIDGLGMKI